MDVFALDKTGSKGRIINGYDELVWTERYFQHGEFKMTTNDIGMMKQLPLGTYISHFETLELMEVLDYEIVKKKGKAPTLAITGSSFDTILEGRVAAPDVTGQRHRLTETTDQVNSYTLAAGNSWNQAATLIDRHISGPTTSFYPGDAVPYLNCVVEVPGTEAEQLSRVIERGQLYERVQELLAISTCGMKSRRPFGNRETIDIVIFQGKDVSDKVNFSTQLDDLDEASYFISKRKLKNAAFICGKYNGYSFFTDAIPATGLDRRWLYVDAADIEDDTDPAAYAQQFKARAQQAFAEYKLVELTQAQVAANVAHRFGKDYSIGDIVGITADFGVKAKRRVAEFVWTFDKSGVIGYPTLAPIE